MSDTLASSLSSLDFMIYVHAGPRITMKSVTALTRNLDQVMRPFAAVTFDVVTLNTKEKKRSEI